MMNAVFAEASSTPRQIAQHAPSLSWVSTSRSNSGSASLSAARCSVSPAASRGARVSAPRLNSGSAAPSAARCSIAHPQRKQQPGNPRARRARVGARARRKTRRGDVGSTLARSGCWRTSSQRRSTSATQHAGRHALARAGQEGEACASIFLLFLPAYGTFFARGCACKSRRRSQRCISRHHEQRHGTRCELALLHDSFGDDSACCWSFRAARPRVCGAPGAAAFAAARHVQPQRPCDLGSLDG